MTYTQGRIILKYEVTHLKQTNRCWILMNTMLDLYRHKGGEVFTVAEKLRRTNENLSS